MRLLVTGGAGFIGSNLVRMARADQIEDIVVLDDLSIGRRESLDGLHVDLRVGSITDHDALESALHGVDTVVHLAARTSVLRSVNDPVSTHIVNVTGTLMLLEACRRADVQHVIGASSSSVYGLNPSMPKTERSWVRPMSPYGVSKLAAEQYLLAYQTSYGLPTLALRLFNVYGPGQLAGHPYAAVIPKFLDAMLTGRPLLVHGDGHQTRAFTYVDGVCQTLLTAVRTQATHTEPINVALGVHSSVRDIIALLERLTGIAARVVHGPARTADVRHSEADGTRFAEVFPGIEATPLIDGLVRTIEWMRSFPDAVALERA